jgi:GH24 family phage-related lysozyme (muramidase)
VPVLTDTENEQTETATLTLTSPNNAVIEDDSTYAELVIIDDDEPTLTIANETVSESNSTGTFTVTLDKAAASDVTVVYNIADGSSNGAIDGTDYTAVTGTLTIAAGATSGEIEVPVILDSTDEVDETATLTLSSATSATIDGDTTTADFVITDDDTPVLTVANSTVTESAGSAIFTVTLDQAAANDVTVVYQTANGSSNGASSASDYTATTGTLTITAGATTGEIAIPITDDVSDESTETATITLNSAVSATIDGDSTTADLVITDDDDYNLTIADTTVAEAMALVRRKEVEPVLAAQVFVTLPPYEAPTGRYLGVVHFQKLLRYPPHERLGSILDTEQQPIALDTPIAQIHRDLASYDLVALPVTDDQQHLMGVVTVDDVLDHLLPDDWRSEEDN